jgi:hypothetical protein
MIIRTLILCSALLLVSACAPIQATPMNQPEPASDTQVITQTSAAPAVVDLSKVTPSAVEEGAQEVKPAPGVPDAATQIVQQMLLDLSEKQGVDISQIEVASVEAMTWPDGGLGCPQPGMMYVQVLIDGYKVVLKAKGQEFDYHSGGPHFVLCEK